MKRWLMALAIFSFTGLGAALCLSGAMIDTPRNWHDWVIVFYFGMVGLTFFLGGLYASYQVLRGKL